MPHHLKWTFILIILTKYNIYQSLCMCVTCIFFPVHPVFTWLLYFLRLQKWGAQQWVCSFLFIFWLKVVFSYALTPAKQDRQLPRTPGCNGTNSAPQQYLKTTGCSKHNPFPPKQPNDDLTSQLGTSLKRLPSIQHVEWAMAWACVVVCMFKSSLMAHFKLH